MIPFAIGFVCGVVATIIGSLMLLAGPENLRQMGRVILCTLGLHRMSGSFPGYKRCSRKGCAEAKFSYFE